jgi:ribonuclease inhibitor
MNEADDVVWQLLNVDKVTVRGCSDNSVMVHAAEALASPHVRVKTLWLRGGLRVGGAEALGQVLGANTTVEKVMFFGDDDFEEGCMEAMSRCFSVNTTLTDLSFFYCQLGVVDAVSLAKALQVNTSVELLNLTGNAFGNAGATALAELLSRANSKLKELCFIESGIGSAGAAALGRALLVNTNLVTLNLGGNTEIGNAGAIALAPGLAKNTRLKSLFVGNCGIGGTGEWQPWVAR